MERAARRMDTMLGLFGLFLIGVLGWLADRVAGASAPVATPGLIPHPQQAPGRS